MFHIFSGISAISFLEQISPHVFKILFPYFYWKFKTLNDKERICSREIKWRRTRQIWSIYIKEQLGKRTVVGDVHGWATEHQPNIVLLWLSWQRIHLQCSRQRRCTFDPWVGKMPCRRTWQPTSVFLPEKSHGQVSLLGYGPKGCKESDTTEKLSPQHI